MTTPRLGAPELVQNQATPETTVNEQIRYLEAGAGHFIFKDRDLATPPATPADGDCYLVATSGTGDWSGHDDEIAFFVNTAWAFITPIEGFTAWVNDENAFIGYDGSSWSTLSSPVGNYVLLTGDTMTGALEVPDDAYDATDWDGNVEVPTKNAVRDKIESVIAGAGANIEILDEGVSATTNVVSLDFVGTGVSAVDDGSGNVTVTVSGGGGGSGNWQLQFGPLQNEAPSANYATLDTRNGHAVLDFDAATDESAIFTGVLPADYAGGGLSVQLFWAATSATSGDCIWNAAIERIDLSSLDIDADSFASAQAATTTAPATSGMVVKSTIAFTSGAQMDSLAAGELFRLKITRDADNVSDTMTGDAELLRVMVVEA